MPLYDTRTNFIVSSYDITKPLLYFKSNISNWPWLKQKRKSGKIAC